MGLLRHSGIGHAIHSQPRSSCITCRAYQGHIKLLPQGCVEKPPVVQFCSGKPKLQICTEGPFRYCRVYQETSRAQPAWPASPSRVWYLSSRRVSHEFMAVDTRGQENDPYNTNFHWTLYSRCLPGAPLAVRSDFPFLWHASVSLRQSRHPTFQKSFEHS